MFAYGWDGQRRWSLLGQWWGETVRGVQLADMDGDKQRELAVAFPKKVLIFKFEDGRWRKIGVEVPFVEYEHFSLSPLGLRYGGREWAVFQEAGTFRCVAIALERQR